MKKITCPRGFFMMSSQCFKIFNDRKRNWSDAKTKCEEEGYMLAQPAEAVAVSLRKFVVETYGNCHTWIGAQGDGSKFVWNHEGQALKSNMAIWHPGHPGSNVGRDKCLLLLSYEDYFGRQPAHPYYSVRCSVTHCTLCEVRS
ncbi:unnamed protein product, partial [Meganyctiphanes norvegica]